MKKYFFLLLLLLAVSFGKTWAQQIVDLVEWGVKPNTFTNSSPQLRAAIEACRGQKDVVLKLPGGRIDLWPEGAFQKELYISNTTENDTLSKVKSIAFWLEDQEGYTIEGNNTLVVLHGKMVSFAAVNSNRVTIRDISFDYERPTMSEMTIRTITNGEMEIDIHPDSRFTIENERLVFYGNGWRVNSHFTILFRPRSETMHYSSFAPVANARAVQTAPLTVRLEGDFARVNYQQGDVITVRDPYRDNCGAFINLSRNVRLENLNMHYMHGMGIVSQFSENISLDRVNVVPRANSGRIVAAFADVFHFSGCRGLIEIENCHTSGSHDDPINVHGTYLKITNISENNIITVRFMHHQTWGFEAFFAGDSIAFVNALAIQPLAYGRVKTAKLVNLREMEIELDGSIPKSVAAGQVIENTTWTPEVIIRNNRFERTNTRGILVASRRETLIENNSFLHTGMHGILIGVDASGWFESGSVYDVTIRNNRFVNCGYNSAPNNYAIAIAPENHEWVKGYYVHRNIRIEGNTFKVYDSPLLTAKSTAGLSFVNNTVVRDDFGELPQGNRPGFNLNHCRDVTITGNTWQMPEEPVINTTQMRKRELKTDLKEIIRR